MRKDTQRLGKAVRCEWEDVVREKGGDWKAEGHVAAAVSCCLEMAL